MEFFEAIICTTLKDELSSVCIWDANNGTLVSKYRGGGVCKEHGLAANGGYILTCEKGKPLVHVWSLNKQHPENKRLIAPGKISALAFSPESTHIAISVNEKVHLYKTCTGHLLGIASRHFQPITVMKFSSDGSLLCCGGEDGLITVWDVQVFCIKEKSPEAMFTFSEHTLPIKDMHVSFGKNAKLFSVSEDMTCKIFDLVTGESLLSIVFYVKLSCVTISPVETYIFLGNVEGGIHFFSLTSPPRALEHYLDQHESTPAFVGHEKAVTSLACTIDCQHLISGSLDETIKIWDITSKCCLKTISQKGPVTNISYIPFFPKKVFDPNFKPIALIHDFINPTNIDENAESSVEVFHPKDLMTMDDASPMKINLSKGKKEASQDLLKTINRRLYKFALNKILEKRPTDVQKTIDLSKVKKTIGKKKYHSLNRTM